MNVFFFRMCELMMSFGSPRWFRACSAGARDALEENVRGPGVEIVPLVC